jgi:hypothetical protein
MKKLKFALIALLSIPQTICAWKVVNSFINPPTKSGEIFGTTVKQSPTETPGFWVALIFLVIISAAVMWLRIGHEEYPWFLALFTVIDILLSPLSVLRVLVSLIIVATTKEEPELHFIDDASEKPLCFFALLRGFRQGFSWQNGARRSHFSERAAICALFLDKADLLWYNTGVGLCTAAPYRMNEKGGCHV